MKLTNKLKERFCKDYKIPIGYFSSPVFEERLLLYDKMFDSLKKWDEFTGELERYKDEGVYFDEYNRVKDAAMASIQKTTAYERFNQENMNRFSLPETYRKIPGKNIYNISNDKHIFLSIDMKKANFSALSYYDKGMFMTPLGIADTWEEFIGSFTDNRHIISSKNVRQVVLGNCNSGRHLKYEKYLVWEMLKCLIDELNSNYPQVQWMEHICFFSNDEVVFDITDVGDYCKIESFVCNFVSHWEKIPFHVEMFHLNTVGGTNGYLKTGLGRAVNTYKLKCLSSLEYPFVLRYLNHEEVQDSDRYFLHEGKTAFLVEYPDIQIDMPILIV